MAYLFPSWPNGTLKHIISTVSFSIRQLAQYQPGLILLDATYRQTKGTWGSRVARVPSITLEDISQDISELANLGC